MYEDHDMRTCIVKDCNKRAIFFGRKNAVGPFCVNHCGVFIRLSQDQRDIIQVHQALGDPIDNKYADWDDEEMK